MTTFAVMVKEIQLRVKIEEAKYTGILEKKASL